MSKLNSGSGFFRGVRRSSNYMGGVISPSTETEYSKMLYWLAVAENSINILELGTFMGTTTEWLLKAAKRNLGYLTTVDQAPVHLSTHRRLRAVCSSTDDFFDNNVEVFDFIFIDAGHEYEVQKRDILNSRKFLINGGVMAVHDTKEDHPPMLEARRALFDVIPEIGGQWSHWEHSRGMSIGEF